MSGSAFSLDTSIAVDETIPYKAAGCPAGIDVEFWKIQGAAHTPELETSYP